MSDASKRAYGRRITSPMAMTSPFDGAATDAYSSRYTMQSQHPDQDAAQALPVLRARAVDLYRNDPLAYAVLSTIRRGVVGTGPRPRFLAESETVRSALSTLWAEWRGSAGWDGVSSWTDVNNGTCDASNLSGDVLILWPDVGDGTGPKIDLVDASRLDTPSDRTPECATCRLGVGYDRYGRVLGYYVRKSEGPDFGGTRDDFNWFPRFRNGRLNASLFRRPSVGRPRQSRGLPLLTPAIHDLKDLREYRKTEVRRATQAAKHTLIIETPDPKQISDAFENAEAVGQGDSIDHLLGRSYGNIPDASMIALGLGEKATVANPPPVNGGTGEYLTAMLRAVAGCTDLPFEEAFSLYANLNYSNARTIRQMAQAVYVGWRASLEAALCAPTASLLVQYWWANGLLGRIPWSPDLVRVKWDWDRPEWVDPQKEVGSNADSIATGQKSILDVCAAQGKDAYAILEQNLAYEKKEAEMRASMGLPPKVVRRGVGPVSAGSPENLLNTPGVTTADESSPEDS